MVGNVKIRCACVRIYPRPAGVREYYQQRKDDPSNEAFESNADMTAKWGIAHDDAVKCAKETFETSGPSGKPPREVASRDYYRVRRKALNRRQGNA